MSEKEQEISQGHDFEPDVIDEQIDNVSFLHAAHGKRLIQDVKHGYQGYRDQNEYSLERVWQRLGHDTTFKETSIASTGDAEDHQGNTVPLRTLFSSSRWSRTQHNLSLLVAAVIIAILIGSSIVVFYHAKTATGGGINNRDTATKPPKAIYIITGVGNYQAQISRVDEVTHRMVWSYNAGLSAQYTLQNDTIYATATSTIRDGSTKYLSAIDAQTGKLRWHIATLPDLQRSFVTDPMFKQSGFVTNDYGYLQKVVESNGTVYAIDQGGQVLAFRAQDGRSVWSKKLNIQVNASSKVDFDLSAGKGIVYVAALNHLFGLDAKTGKPVWTVQLDAKEVFGQMQITDNSLYVDAFDTTGHNTDKVFNNNTLLFAFRAQDGHKQWQRTFHSSQASPPTVIDGVIYMSTYDGNVYALNASSGSVLWTYYPGSRVNEGQPIVSDGVVYVDQNGNGSALQDNTMRPAIVALDLRGRLLWQIISDDIKTSISVQAVANGIVYTTKVLYGSNVPGKLITYDARGNVLWQQGYKTSDLLTVIVVP